MKPLLSGILSFLMPGLGQVKNGQLVKGIIFYLIHILSFFICYSFKIMHTFNGLIVVVFLSIVLYLIYIGDAIYFSTRTSSKILEFKKYWFVYLILIILNFLFLSQYKKYINSNFIMAHKTKTSSMEPTLMTGDRFIADYRYYKTNPVKPNDVVIIRLPKDPKKKFIERCIATGEQVVEIKGKSVFVDGVLFPDSLKTQFIGESEDYGPVKVPPEHYFVLGDNRDNSYDSRYWGFVPKENVIAKPLYIYWSKDKTRIGKTID